MATTAEQVPMLDRPRLPDGARDALAELRRDPPHDVQKLEAPEPERAHGVMTTTPGWRRAARRCQHDDDLRAAADVLAGRALSRLLVGQGARDARDEVVAIAQRLGAGIATSLLGKPYVDESLPFATGTMGHLGTTASADLMAGCDSC